MPDITLQDIRAAAEQLANAHNDTAATVAFMQAEIKDAIAPIMERYRPTLDKYAEAETTWQRRLDELLAMAPQLFKSPRSITVDGVKVGYRKAEDTIDWDNKDVIIARIEGALPESVDLLVRTERNLNVDALALLEPEQLQKLGVRTIKGVDIPFVKIGDNDTEALAKFVIAAAQSRQGEDDPAKVKKGKAKAKVAA